MTRITQTAIALAIAVSLGIITPSAQHPTRRATEQDHYTRLAALPSAPAGTSVDALRFPLDKWGDLYAWRLLKPHYMTAPLSAFTALTPPANSSPQTRAELDYLLKLQASRTAEEQAWCEQLAGIYYHPLIVNPADTRFGANRDNLFFVGRGLGPQFSQRHLPKTADLLARVYHDAMIQVVELKLHYARPRPHHLEARLRAEDARIPHGSYPSGHSFASYLNAEILARLAPGSTEMLFASARDMAWSRELLGVHYPSDSEAGRIFARDFARLLFDNVPFRRDFAAVQQEWAATASW